MTTVFEHVLQWAQEQQLLTTQGEDDIVFQVNGRDGSWISRVKAIEEDGLIYILCAYPFHVVQSRRAQAALALDRISSELKLGVFYLDQEDGQINFRMGQFIWPLDPEETAQRVQNLIMLAMSVADNYYRRMLALAAEE